MSWAATDVLRVSRWASLAPTSRGYAQEDPDVDAADRPAVLALFDSIVDAGVHDGAVSALDAAAWRMRFQAERNRRRPGRLASRSQPTLRSARRRVASFIAQSLNDAAAPPLELVAAVARRFESSPPSRPARQEWSARAATATARKQRSRVHSHEVADAQRRAAAVATGILNGWLESTDWSSALSAAAGGTSRDVVAEFGSLYEALNAVGDRLAPIAAWIGGAFAPDDSYERAEMLGNTATSLVRAREFRAALAMAAQRPTVDLRERPDREARLFEQELLIRLAPESANRDVAVRLFRQAGDVRTRLDRSGIETEWRAVLGGRLVQLSYLLVGHERTLARHTLDLAIESLEPGRTSTHLRHIQAVRRYVAAAVVARAPADLERALTEAAGLCTGSHLDQEERIDLIVKRARRDPALVESTGPWRDVFDLRPHASGTVMALSFDRYQDLRWAF